MYGLEVEGLGLGLFLSLVFKDEGALAVRFGSLKRDPNRKERGIKVGILGKAINPLNVCMVIVQT